MRRWRWLPLRAAFEAGLEEEAAQPPAAQAAAPVVPAARLDYDGQLVAGISASPGIAAGPAWVFQHERLEVTEKALDPAREHERLDKALAGANAELHNLYQEFL
ncbi:phosphoenolpyruvate-utilizing N-terminal domain-containing protein, partial [Pyxidicoccus sp. 3LG]